MWTAWDTHPSRPEFMDPVWRDGWLTFESATARRRLAPIPKGWSEAAPTKLELMCKTAAPSRRETPPHGSKSAVAVAESEV